MYRKKLFAFGLSTAIILVIALACASVSAYLTKANLVQSNLAQSLLVEHQHLSSVSYRLFKQFTDQYIFGANANQADVRNKQALIDASLKRIRTLELEQRQALGSEVTQGSVEDTDDLEQIITTIIAEFQAVLNNASLSELVRRERLFTVVEVSIDNRFREAIDSAVVRQGRVVAALNARIETLNAAMIWFTVGLGLISLCLVIYGCYWLFGQLYQPLVHIQTATDRIANGNYDTPITEQLDGEFEALVESINTLGQRLQVHEEKELESRKELEFQVEQRTQELTQANLKLTQVDSRRQQFINDISHELRTPLTIIRGEAQITLRLDSATQTDYQNTLTAILNQSVALSRLVDDLLLLARAEINELHLQLSPTSIVPLLDGEVNKWQRLAEVRKLELKVAHDLADIQLDLDAARIRQALSILLDNAIKYSAADSYIVVSANRRKYDLVISVEDRGRGISAAELDHIFERFVRFNKHEEGLGLGLPIAKVIIEAHGGEISAQSVQGQGSIFSLYLPFQKDD